MTSKDYILELFPNANDSDFIKLDKFYELLIKYNEVMNLTSITEYDEVYIKHFYDSLLLCKVLDINNKTLCDVGSGAGFPGIPLAIFTNSKISIIDALQKRINFLNDVIKELDLNNVSANHIRAEEYVKTKRSSFDVVTARAVAKLNVLVELCLPLVRVGGYFVALKGSNEEELKEANNALNVLGAKLVQTYSFDLPREMGKRHIYLFEKVKECSSKYPRSFAKIKTNPL